jgi:hypothetical protein
MMCINKSNSFKSFRKEQSESTSFQSQEKTIFQFLFENIATSSMVSKATGIPQKNICRAKRNFELEGKLKEVRRGICNVTGFKAYYLSTNPNVWEQ